MSNLTLVSNVLCFGGEQRRYRHTSSCNQCEMTFGIFLPSQVIDGDHHASVLYWLSGLSCNDENFVQKSSVQRYAEELGLIIVAPDTSPRGDQVPDDDDKHWDFGLGAGFYVDAQQAPWSTHYNMFTYITKELPALIDSHFPTNGEQSIFGHSMGGHGALIAALKCPTQYKSVSAFAPISNPSQVPWGQKAFSHYLGKSPELWQEYDTCSLMEKQVLQIPGLVDQGSNDAFLDEQLKIDRLTTIAKEAKAHLQIDIQEGYDHSYFFIASFIEKHLHFHASYLK